MSERTEPANEIVTVDVDNPAHGGSVIARMDGQVVFLSGGLPGEKDVTVALDPAKGSNSKKSFRTGTATHIGKPSPHRVEGQCAAASLGGGCCDLDFVDAQGSLEFKRDVVLDQLRRIGKIELDEAVISAESLTPSLGWRTRARLGVDEEGRAGVRKKNSHEVIPLSAATCAQWAAGLVAGLEEETFPAGAEIAVALGEQAGGKIDGEGAQRSVVQLTGSRQRPQRKVIGGLKNVTHHVKMGDKEIAWDLPADAFWQGHRAAPEFYSQWLRQNIPADLGLGWDLYGGAGVFAAALSDRVGAMDTVDTGSLSTDAGKEALAAAGIENVRFLSGEVSKSLDALRTNDEEGHGLHVVVLDPPRTGAGAKVVERIAEFGPRYVAHVGCDPATASRDLAAWIQSGYEIKQLTIVDAFPLTHHVEMLVLLQRVGE